MLALRPNMLFFAEKLGVYLLGQPAAGTRWPPAAWAAVLPTTVNQLYMTSRDVTCHHMTSQIRESSVLHLPVNKLDTDWHTSDRMDHVRASPCFGIRKEERYDTVSQNSDVDGEVWYCKVNYVFWCHVI